MNLMMAQPTKTQIGLPSLSFGKVMKHTKNTKNLILSSFTFNKPQQSLPLVAGTAKTLRLFVCPCAGRYKFWSS